MKTLIGFNIPKTAQHWIYLIAVAFIGSAAGAIQGGGNWHEALMTGVIAVAGFLKAFPLPAAAPVPPADNPQPPPKA